MKYFSILMILFSFSSFAANGKVSKTLSHDLVQTLWSNGAELLSPADAFFKENIYDKNSILVKEIKKVYQENVVSYAQPKFPQDFANFSLKSKATLISEGNSSLEFGKNYIVPLYGATGPKMNVLIAWIHVSINGQIDGETTISLEVIENSLFF